MRPGITLLLIVTGCAAFASAVSPLARGARAYQHIANGGFEDGLAGWSAAPGVTIDVSSEAPAEGLASARVVIGSSAARIEYRLTGALAPAAYNVSLQGRSASGASITLSVAPAPQPRFEIGGGGVAPSWTAVSGTFTLGEAAITTLMLRIEAQPGAEVFLDDVRLDGAGPVTLTPTPTLPAASPTPQAGTTALAGSTVSPAPSGTPAPTQTASAAVDVIAGSLRNAGFEDIDATGAPFAWAKYGGVLASDGHARSGARAARLDSGTGSTKWLHQAVTIEGGTWYAFEAWALQDDRAVASAFLRISWYASGDGGGTALHTVDSTTVLDAPSPGYRYLTTGGVLAPADARSARVRVMLAPVSDAPASILVDDAWFGPGAPTPPTAIPTMPVLTPAGNAPPDDGSAPAAPASAGRHSGSGGLPPAVAGISSAADSSVVINEVLYDADSDTPDAEAEWVEIYNGGDVPVDLAGWTLRDGAATDTLPAAVVAAHQFAIVAATDVFGRTYPDVTAPVAVLGGRIGNALGNDGDRLYLVDPAGAIVDAVSWGDDISAFDPATDDVPAGHSIERESAGVDSNTAVDFIDNERPSPGSAYEAPAASKPQGSTRGVRIIEGAGSGALGWLPWAIATASAVACAATVGWRTIDVVRRARHP
jgi:lamin tail-like protein/carbohydrate binding protein with CBM4/9 domain